jgi:uncharacterized protein DUF3485
MNRQKLILLIVALLMIGGGAGTLAWFQTHQRLGRPGIKTRPLPDTVNVEILIPEKVLDYSSTALEQQAIVTNTLPKDTSFAQRLYQSTNGFQMLMNVVLMGTDRTSLHKPQFCLQGQGWQIDQQASATTTVPMERPVPYQLPVVKLIASKQVEVEGQRRDLKGVYVYYYVADGALSASSSGFERMWWMAKEMVRTGVLQRWAYVTYFAVCPPGQENATFEKMKKFIIASAPEFQLTPKPAETTLSAR